MSGAVRIAAVLAAAAAAAFVASFMLLGVATGRDPVGRLTPQSAFVHSPQPVALHPAAPPRPFAQEHEQHPDD